MTDVKVLKCAEFEVEMYHQTIRVEAVSSEGFGWNAMVENPDNPLEPICVKLDLSKIDTNVIVHESIHVAMYICQRTLMMFEPGNHEHFAYLVEFVFGRLHKIAWDMKQSLDNEPHPPRGKSEKTKRKEK
jgi:hypothetical protein